MLPLDQTSRVFVSILRKDGYSVDYHEFYGKHEVTSAVSDQAMAWLKTVFQKQGR
jgi:predicted esterase